MKKICFVILSVLLCGCSSTKDVEEKKTIYKDGTYTSTAQGYGGNFEVQTILKDDKIVDVIVKEHNETPSIGGVAIEQIITKMKEKNTYDVDVISGATKTSQGMIAAVEDSMKNAKNTTK
ncbi:MAG: FMN-binding protein [Coprobacillus sp.]|nr:FMN-binding protein [Coprobacillus sp.]